MNLEKRRFDRRCLMGMISVLLAGCVGCSSGLVTVEGEVTFNGQPVEQGTIVFEPADGAGPSAGGSIQDGCYRLEGDSAVAPGKKTVRITAVRKTGRRLEAGPPDPPGTMADEMEHSQHTLACEVSADGDNRHDFELTSE